jgi:hypothetical protein
MFKKGVWKNQSTVNQNSNKNGSANPADEGAMRENTQFSEEPDVVA